MDKSSVGAQKWKSSQKTLHASLGPIQRSHNRKGKKDSNTVQAILPGGLIGTLHLLGVSLNRSFETHMRNQWTRWMADGKAELTAKENFKRPPLPTVVSWVKNAWHMISPEMIQKSFLKYCISNKLDGTQDDVPWQENSNETENEDSDEEAESGNEDHDEKMWNDDNIKYTLEDWKYVFGESEDVGDSEEDLKILTDCLISKK